MVRRFRSKRTSTANGDVNARHSGTPPPSPCDFPCVDKQGFLAVETMQPPSSCDRKPAHSSARPRSRVASSIKAEMATVNSNDMSKGPRRRPSIEERTRQSAYHNLLQGGDLTSDDNEEVEEVEESEYQEESPPTEQQSPAIGPLTPKYIEAAKPPRMLNVLCGTQDPESKYFTRRLVQISNNSFSNDDTTSTATSSLLCSADVDADANELYRIWRHTGVIPTRYRDIGPEQVEAHPEHTWLACWPLMNAAIYGNLCKDVDFSDQVMDLLDEKVVKGVRPNSDTISHMFSESKEEIPDTLRRFVVDRWIDANMEGVGDVDLCNQPRLFVHVALKSSLRRLSQRTETTYSTGCAYHAHVDPEDCYMKTSGPARTRKNERYRMRREKSRVESAQVAADAHQSGIKTIDWEQRRLCDVQSRRDQTPASWIDVHSQSNERLDLEFHEARQYVGEGGQLQRSLLGKADLDVALLTPLVIHGAHVDGVVGVSEFGTPATSAAS